MASMLVSSMAADFDPAQFDDEYRKAVEELIEFKRQHGDARPAPAAAETSAEPISDLLTALRRSVEEARAERGVPKPRTARKPADEPPDEDNPTRTRGRPRTSTPKTPNTDKNPTTGTRKPAPSPGKPKPAPGSNSTSKPATTTNTRKPASTATLKSPTEQADQSQPKQEPAKKAGGPRTKRGA